MKKKRNYFIIMLILLFTIFLIIDFSYKNGYIEYKNKEKSLLTKEAMERFEEDIRLGKDISINDYINNDNIDYRSKVSNIGVKVGKIIEDFITEGMSNIVKILGKMFTN